MENYQRTFIELALQQQALRFGEFTLKSGRVSPYFFNMGQLYSGAVLRQLGECYAQCIQRSQIDFDVLFGPAYKGIPLACTTVIALSALGRHVPYSFNRKEAKDHGEGGQVVGAPLKGKILIIDDVITAGTAIRGSVELITSQGATVAGIVVALDRQERGVGQRSALQEIQEALQIPVQALITFTDILVYLQDQSAYAGFSAAMLAYRQQYGI